MVPYALALALIVGLALPQSQIPPQTPQRTVEPEFLDQYVALLGGQIVPLERETATTDTQSRRNFVITPSTRVFQSIPQPTSSVRVPSNTHFLVRMSTGDRDPLTLIHLQPLKPGKKDREITNVTYRQSLIPFGGVKHERADDNSIVITVRKTGADTLEIVPQAPLPPGEYAFVNGHEAQCFGVDAGSTAGQTSADALQPQLTVSATPTTLSQPPLPAHPPNTALDTAPAAPGYPVLHAAEPAFEGCWWTPWVSQRYALEMLVQRCEPGKGFGGMETIFADSDQGVTVRQANETEPGLLFAVRTKLAAQGISAAIREQFISKLKLTPARKAACHVKGGSSGGKDFGPLESWYVTGPCTSLESDDAVGRTFLYAPSESKTKFLFLETEDAWPFDRDSIRFLPEP